MAQQLPVAVVCRVLGAPRSSVYARRARTDPLVRPGPATSINDTDLLGLIHQVLATSPFAGEGYRKVRARLRRQHGVRVSGKRVLPACVNLSEACPWGNHCVVVVFSLGSLIQTAVGSAGGWGGLRTKRSGCSA